MKLQHHLGGLEGLDGPIALERRVFVEEWEKRIFGIHVAMMGLSDHLDEALPRYPMDEVPTAFASTWTWADLRKGAEAMNPFAYFQYRYYEKWLGGITSFFIANGYLTEDELEKKTDECLRDPDLLSATGDQTGEGGGEGEGDDPVDAQVMRYLREGDSPRRGPATPTSPSANR